MWVGLFGHDGRLFRQTHRSCFGAYPSRDRQPRDDAADLITAFERVGMTARASRVELDELRSLSRPAILHWSFNHFVVLVKVTRRGAVILDPAIGRRSISLRELSDKFTGVLVEAWPAETFDKKALEMNVTVSDLFRGVRGLRRILPAF